ncbi:hypothetical protein BN946_scf184969.g24 [Trametes cinnabarina]|uniref:Protein kinase domain-containing protein n=1 Tax=Pycnoporus cinnabarinus TaxID=5643 RepID=A0A060SYP0_PYCCI|nr:hypothetical protein BN946_scf184969.g24 [Trametes cinnabarina]
MVSPVFEDYREPAAALILEYLPNSEALGIQNLTPQRADMALRALSHVHEAHVLHGDVWKSRNILFVRDGDSGLERVALVDFDHPTDPVRGEVSRVSLLKELSDTWILFYNYMVRLMCVHRVVVTDSDSYVDLLQPIYPERMHAHV